MKQFFAATLALLLGLSGVAWRLQSASESVGKVVLSYSCPTFKAKVEQVELFNRTHPDVEVRIDASNTGMEKVIIQSVAGVGPDLFNSYSVFQTSAYVKAGIAWDLTGELKKAGVDVKKIVWPTAYEHVVVDGRVYGFPYDASVDALHFNKTLFDRHGIPYPKGTLTREQFLELARKLTVRDETGRIEHFGFLYAGWTWPWFVMQWGGRVYTEDGTRCVLDSPEVIEAIQFLQDLIYTYRVTPSPVQEAGMATSGGWGSGAVTWFGGGLAAMATGGRFWLVALRDKKNYPDLRLGAVECRFGPHRTYQSHCGLVMINRHSPRRREALEYLLYMAGRPYNELVNHQADGLGPVKAFCYTDSYLHDPEFPEENANEVWREVLNYGHPVEDSPFVNGAVANRIIMEQLELVRAQAKSAAEAMQEAARQVNEQIRKNLRRDPLLRARYERIASREGTRP